MHKGVLVPDISPTRAVIQVFDRMLATDEEIQNKETTRPVAAKPASLKTHQGRFGNICLVLGAVLLVLNYNLFPYQWHSKTKFDVEAKDEI